MSPQKPWYASLPFWKHWPDGSDPGRLDICEKHTALSLFGFLLQRKMKLMQTHCQIMFWKTGYGCNTVLAHSSSLCVLLFPLSVSPFFFHIHTTHCKVCLWCLSALSLEWLHNTLESTHQTLVLWVWVDHISTLFDHQRGSSVQADTFYAVRKLCRSAVCQYATTKVDDI